MQDDNEQDLKRRSVPSSAAEWFVAIEAEGDDLASDADFAAWLAADPQNERALARCAAALGFAKEIAIESPRDEVIDAVASARALPRAAARAGAREHRTPVAAASAWLARPAVAWTAAALAILVAAAAWLRGPAPVSTEPGAPATGEAAARAARSGAADPLDIALSDTSQTNPTVILPGQVVVDARSIAILPFVLAEDTAFAADEDARAAAGLYARIVARLAAIPGFYVLSPESIAPFADLGMSPAEIATQLGVRGIAEARISVEERQFHVDLRLTDASSSTLLIDSAYVRSADEMDGMQADIVANIALAMAGPANPASVETND